MLTCKKCGDEFLTYAIIEGKKRILSSRKYCLKCSPYKQHNTKKIHLDDPKDRICKGCGREFEYRRSAGHFKDLCCSCVTRKRFRAVKRRAVEYKGGGCCICGYSKAMSALAFHHTDGDKEFTIGGAYNRSWKALKKELDKCVLVCANHHAEVHEGLIEIGG